MKLTTRIVTGVTLLLVLLAASASKSNPIPEPIPLMSEEDISGSMENDEISVRSDARSTLQVLWDGRLDLLLMALRSSHSDVRQQAIRGLGAIGNFIALEAIRGVLADSTGGLEDAAIAGGTLAWLADTSSVPLISWRLQRAEASSAASPVTPGDWPTQDSIRRLRTALEWLERPDLTRPLIIRDARYVRFRFLLDDIASITLKRRSSDDVPIHEFDRSEFRDICGLLQQGRFVEPGVITEVEVLQFLLVDGRRVDLTRWNNQFYRGGGAWDRGFPAFCVESSKLAEFIDRSVGRRSDDEHPATGPGESPN